MQNEPHYILPGEDGFKNELLDVCLAAGYYRMQHLMFTTVQTQIDADASPLPVFWLRTVVGNIKESRSVKKIKEKCSFFNVIVKPASISTETDKLYALYREHIDFNAAADCTEYLQQRDIENPFHSNMIEVRDGSNLIAVGYFDQGKNAIAGILNFYHPDYKKYSLGKFLMLQKILYATNNNFLLYYTGYISTAISKFDYKLFPDAGAMEVYLPAAKLWVSYNLLGKAMLEKYFTRYHL